MNEQTTLRLVLTGDSMITRHAFIRQNDTTQRLRALIRDADVAFTNIESLPNDFRGDPAVECGGTHMAAPSAVIDDLVAVGFDLFACATNHSLDYSIAGLLATLEALEQRRVAFAGIGRTLTAARMPTYFESAGGVVALLSCVSSFAKGHLAADQRPDMQGRPGINPLRVETIYEVTREQREHVREIADALGVEQRRQELIHLGFAFPPDDPDIFPFLDQKFRMADAPAIRTSANEKDVAAITTWVHEARARADVVLLSLHMHDQGATKEEPPEFTPIFARRMLDEGADMVVMHGPHLLRGMEMYRGKPIFYSLGNFVAQNDLVRTLPADSYERFRVDPDKTPSEVFSSRSKNGTAGFPADKRYWQTVMPNCSIEEGKFARLEIMPITLGHGQPVHRRGRPQLAEGEEAREILTRFAALSAPFGTTMEVEHDRASVMIDACSSTNVCGDTST